MRIRSWSTVLRFPHSLGSESDCADSDSRVSPDKTEGRGRRSSPTNQTKALLASDQPTKARENRIVLSAHCSPAGAGTMKRIESKLPLLAIFLAVLLLPTTVAAAIAKAIDASTIQRLELPDVLVGPESVAFDAHGAGPYVSISDGRVLKYGGEGVGWTTFACSPSYTKNMCDAFSELPPVATESSCGRPLGLRFHKNSGNLYIADAYMGLMRVGPNGGEATVLATEAGGVPLRFTNGVDIDQVTGDVYFTDSSTTYTRAQHQMVTSSGDSTGRIMKYIPRTNQVTVLQSGVTYPNGIAISADRTHLFVALTGPCKLLKYWI
ncbi:hypothetical protein HU200_023222 [Digitaria exilis]|uniref:Strictosidine synthase conserved region domain-containing protein n=1 Tax=Digitaria exilis TaxID=1010633 RepID=A0A835C0C5_9POAL|nr:hypothetical protein HU200_023222 [Digitaria exilis]